MDEIKKSRDHHVTGYFRRNFVFLLDTRQDK